MHWVKEEIEFNKSLSCTTLGHSTTAKGLGIGARTEFQLRFLQHNTVTPPQLGHTLAKEHKKKHNTAKIIGVCFLQLFT